MSTRLCHKVAPWLAQLVLGGQVDPKLKPMHVSGRAFGHLTVYDASAGGHPLDTTRANHTLQEPTQRTT